MRRHATIAALSLASATVSVGCGLDEPKPYLMFVEPGPECPRVEHSEPPPTTGARNVVLILTDDQGYDLSYPPVGRRGVSTPHMDALASRGVFFTRAFAAAAVCSASRAALLTGLQPHTNGHWCNTNGIPLTDPDLEFTRQTSQFDGQMGVHDDVTTLVEILAESGYFTGITQKLHVSPPWKFPFESRKGAAARTPESFRQAVGELLDEAGRRPFFVMANVGHPHRPFDPEQAGATVVDPAGVDVPGWLPDTDEVRLDRAEYLGAVEAADRCVGAILDTLEARGALDDTLVIFTSDQGPGFHRAKASAYPAGLHVPLAIAGPGIASGLTWSGAVSHLDLAPTILASLGLAVPAAMQGRSLWSALGGASSAKDSPRLVFASESSHGPLFVSHFPSRMVTDGDHYLIANLVPTKPQRLPDDLRLFERWRNRSYDETVAAAGGPFDEQFQILDAIERGGRPSFELYHLGTDEDAMDDLADRPDHAATLERLSDELGLWRQCSGDFVSSPEEVVRRRHVLGDGATTVVDFAGLELGPAPDVPGLLLPPGLASLGASAQPTSIVVSRFPPFSATESPYLEVALSTEDRMALLVQYRRKGDLGFDAARTVRQYAEAGEARLLFDMRSEEPWRSAIVALRLIPVVAPGTRFELGYLRRGSELAVDPPAP